MGRWVTGEFTFVVTASDDGSVAYDESADRYITVLDGLGGLLERHGHQFLVAHDGSLGDDKAGRDPVGYNRRQP